MCCSSSPLAISRASTSCGSAGLPRSLACLASTRSACSRAGRHQPAQPHARGQRLGRAAGVGDLAGRRGLQRGHRRPVVAVLRVVVVLDDQRVGRGGPVQQVPAALRGQHDPGGELVRGREQRRPHARLRARSPTCSPCGVHRDRHRPQAPVGQLVAGPARAGVLDRDLADPARARSTWASRASAWATPLTTMMSSAPARSPRVRASQPASSRAQRTGCRADRRSRGRPRWPARAPPVRPAATRPAGTRTGRARRATGRSPPAPATAAAAPQRPARPLASAPDGGSSSDTLVPAPGRPLTSPSSASRW